MKFWKRAAKWQGRRFKETDHLALRVLGSAARRVTANHLTLIGLACCVPMMYFYLTDRYLVASLLLIASALTDWFDGALANAQQGDRPVMTYEQEMRLTILQRINYRGVTHLGKWVDPGVDKVRFFGALYPLGWGVVSTWLIISLTCVALCLMLVRPAKRWLNMGDGTSTRWGKIKAWSEYAALALLVFYPVSKVLLDLIFIVALLLGLSSLGSHLLAGYFVRRKQLRAQSKRRPLGRPFSTADNDHSP